MKKQTNIFSISNTELVDLTPVTSAFLTQASIGCTVIIHLTIVWIWDFVAGIACSFPLEFIIAQWD
jgi:hypothetical protein